MTQPPTPSQPRDRSTGESSLPKPQLGAQIPRRTAVGRVLSASSQAPGTPGAGPRQAARSVHLAWLDPVTGEHLRIAMMATPEMIQRLQREGFALEAEITRSAG